MDFIPLIYKIIYFLTSIFMKKLLSFLIIALFLVWDQTFALSYTRWYIKKSWTYVAPHYKTSPNKTKIDNYSSKGNYNPFTGKKGYKKW